MRENTELKHIACTCLGHGAAEPQVRVRSACPGLLPMHFVGEGQGTSFGIRWMSPEAVSGFFVTFCVCDFKYITSLNTSFSSL